MNFPINNTTLNQEVSTDESFASSIQGEEIFSNFEITDALEKHSVDPDECESAIRVSTAFKTGLLGDGCGVWLNPLAYVCHGAFLMACGEVHRGEEDPQFEYVDWKDIPGQFITANSVSPDLWLQLSDWQQLDDEERARAEIYWEDFSTTTPVGLIEEKFVGCFDNERDLGWHLFEMLGYFDCVPEKLHCYFDCESYANDERLNGSLSWCYHKFQLWVFWS